MQTAASVSGRLTTHALDVARGRPASGLRVDLAALDDEGGRRPLVSTTTNGDGRTDAPLLAGQSMAVGRYELTFHVGAYLAALDPPGAAAPFLDLVPVRFAIADGAAHYHVPLLFTPWSYSTYRGS